MDRGEVRRRLGRRREELSSSLRRLVEVPRGPAPSVSFGKRVGDGTTEAVERLNTTSAARSIAATIEEVDAALARLEAGTYGVCARCGAAIPAERLDAVPWAAHCVDCGRALGR